MWYTLVHNSMPCSSSGVPTLLNIYNFSMHCINNMALHKNFSNAHFYYLIPDKNNRINKSI